MPDPEARPLLQEPPEQGAKLPLYPPPPLPADPAGPTDALGGVAGASGQVQELRPLLLTPRTLLKRWCRWQGLRAGFGASLQLKFREAWVSELLPCPPWPYPRPCQLRRPPPCQSLVPSWRGSLLGPADAPSLSHCRVENLLGALQDVSCAQLGLHQVPPVPTPAHSCLFLSLALHAGFASPLLLRPSPRPPAVGLRVGRTGGQRPGCVPGLCCPESAPKCWWGQGHVMDARQVQALDASARLGRRWVSAAASRRAVSAHLSRTRSAERGSPSQALWGVHIWMKRFCFDTRQFVFLCVSSVLHLEGS